MEKIIVLAEQVFVEAEGLAASWRGILEIVEHDKKRKTEVADLRLALGDLEKHAQNARELYEEVCLHFGRPPATGGGIGEALSHASQRELAARDARDLAVLEATQAKARALAQVVTDEALAKHAPGALADYEPQLHSEMDETSECRGALKTVVKDGLSHVVCSECEAVLWSEPPAS